MRDADRAEFGKRLQGLAAVYGRELTNPLIETFWRILADQPTAGVLAAMDAHVRQSRFFPTPAEILAAINAANPDGRPGVEEAWSACLRLMDESKSAVITTEMRDAWAVAWPVVSAGYRLDAIGGRKAFSEAYEMLCRESRTAGVAPKWELQIGTDAEDRARVVGNAVELGRLGSSLALVHQAPVGGGSFALLAHGMQQVARDGDNAAQAQEAIEQLQALKAALSQPYGESDKAKAARLERERFAAKKQSEMEKFDAYVAENYAPPDNVVSMLGVADEGTAHG